MSEFIRRHPISVGPLFGLALFAIVMVASLLPGESLDFAAPNDAANAAIAGIAFAIAISTTGAFSRSLPSVVAGLMLGGVTFGLSLGIGSLIPDSSELAPRDPLAYATAFGVTIGVVAAAAELIGRLVDRPPSE